MGLDAENDKNSNFVQLILDWIADVGIKGMGVLQSAEKVAADHLSKTATPEDAINSIIAWRTACAGATGFSTGVGGLTTMPVTK
jgi:hypothetical protein